MTRELIENLDELIKPHLNNGQKLVSFQCKKLLPSGENYGSVMLQVEIKIATEDGVKEETVVHYVAKTCPPPGILWEVFNTKETFKNEIFIYDKVLPELNIFGKEKGIDCLIDFVAQYIGSRLSLSKEADVVDGDAVLLLENLKLENYRTADKYIGFDLECTKLILSDLARMHAAPIAYRLQHPENFEDKILPYLGRCYCFEFNDDAIEKLIKCSLNSVTNYPDCTPYLKKLEEYVRKMNISQIKPAPPNHLFATLTHNDFWVNNTMLKFEDGEPVSNKIVDFQLNDYSSLAHDVIFFLYSSVELSILQRYIGVLFEVYYDKFIKALHMLGCSTDAYTFEAMMKEFGLITRKVEYSHLIYMLPSILNLKGGDRDLCELKEEELFSNNLAVHENYSKRMRFILLDFIDRKWI